MRRWKSKQHRRVLTCALFSFGVATGALALEAEAVGAQQYEADLVVFETEPSPELEYIHIFREPNVCIYGGFNCAIIVYKPDPINGREVVEAHVLVDAT